MKNDSNVSAAVAAAGTDVVYRRHIAMVRRQAARVLGDEAAAEDAAQEVFVRFLAHRQRGGTEDYVAAFLFRMATNVALNHLRSCRRRSCETIQEEGLAAPADPLRMLRDIMRHSSPQEAEVAACYYLAEMKQEAIAEHLNMSRHKVRQRLQAFEKRARAAVGVF